MAKITDEQKKRIEEFNKGKLERQRNILNPQQERILKMRGIANQESPEESYDEEPEEEQEDEQDFGDGERYREDRPADQDRQSRFQQETQRRLDYIKEQAKQRGKQGLKQAGRAGKKAAGKAGKTAVKAGAQAARAGQAAASAAGSAASAGGIGGAISAAAPVIGVVLAVIAGIALVLFLVFMIITYACNESATLRGGMWVYDKLGLGSNICEVFNFGKGGGQVFSGGDSGGAGATDTWPEGEARCDATGLQTLAEDNGVPYPAKDSPALSELVSCIKNHPLVRGQNLGSEYTIDESHESCNYTRGQKICDDVCSHTTNSCHYGGRTGSGGAEAVDFGLGAGHDTELFEKVTRAANECGAGFVYDEKDHLHISTKACDSDADNY